MIAIVVSRADGASERIGEQLLAIGDWDAREDDDRPDGDGGGTYYRTEGFELRTFDDIHVRLDDPVPAFCGDGRGGTDPPEVLVFVSKHAGETGSLLTAHFTGNFGPADHGGEAGALAQAAPGTQKRVVESLERHAPAGYDVCIECTHHGPTDVSVPSLYVELGSGEPQWADDDAARAVARAVLDLYDPGRNSGPDLIGTDGEPRHVVGFGGGHYAPRFTRIVTETEWAVGHVGADWSLSAMGCLEEHRGLIDRAFERSRAERAVIEGDRPGLATVVESLGYRIVSETWIREVAARPLALVDVLETDLRSVADGLRFGEADPATGDRASSDTVRVRETIAVRALPSDLLARAQGIDPEATRAAVEAHAVAFETEQAGSRAVGRAAFPRTEASGGVEGGEEAGANGRGDGDGADGDNVDGYERLVADLAEVLRERYEGVTIEPGAVVARGTAFDPALASRKGVPEGPAFGRLSAGEPVEVDGEVVEPDEVARTTTDRFPIDDTAAGETDA